jgi:hypothetical protein
MSYAFKQDGGIVYTQRGNNPYLTQETNRELQFLKDSYGIFCKVSFDHGTASVLIIAPTNPEQVVASAQSEAIDAGRTVEAAAIRALKIWDQHPRKQEIIFECLLEMAHVVGN